MQSNQAFPFTSRRFNQYKRDKTLRGRSLALANALEQLKKDEDFREFQSEMIEAIMKIRERGKRTEEIDREKVLKVLGEFSSTLEEIIQDARLTKKEAKRIVKDLLASGAVVEKQQQHHMADSDHFTPFYVLKSR